MSLQRTLGAMLELGNIGFIGFTKFLTDNRLIKVAAKSTPIVGDEHFRYRVDHNWCKSDTRQFPVNNCHEMVVDRLGRLILLTDHPSSNILIFEPTGKIIESWSLGLKSA